MARRIRFEKSSEIGCYATLTNTFALVAEAAPDAFKNAFQDELGYNTPVIETTCGGSNLIGTMIVANCHGVIVPACMTDEELQQITYELPEDVEIAQIQENLNTLGNHIACNDHVALINPNLSEATEETLRKVLKVDVHRTTIAGLELVGSYCKLTNLGGLVHPAVSVSELEQLSEKCQLALCAGTVNRGNATIGSGVLANEDTAFCGQVSTTNEVSLIDAIFKISSKVHATFAMEGQNQLIDTLC